MTWPQATRFPRNSRFIDVFFVVRRFCRWDQAAGRRRSFLAVPGTRQALRRCGFFKELPVPRPLPYFPLLLAAVQPLPLPLPLPLLVPRLFPLPCQLPLLLPLPLPLPCRFAQAFRCPFRLVLRAVFERGERDGDRARVALVANREIGERVGDRERAGDVERRLARRAEISGGVVVSGVVVGSVIVGGVVVGGVVVGGVVVGVVVGDATIPFCRTKNGRT